MLPDVGVVISENSELLDKKYALNHKRIIQIQS